MCVNMYMYMYIICIYAQYLRGTANGIVAILGIGRRRPIIGPVRKENQMNQEKNNYAYPC